MNGAIGDSQRRPLPAGDTRFSAQFLRDRGINRIQLQQVIAMVADIAQLDAIVSRQLTLQGQVVLLHRWRFVSGEHRSHVKVPARDIGIAGIQNQRGRTQHPVVDTGVRTTEIWCALIRIWSCNWELK